ncbi:DUF1858 domain-containing protein [candidate division WOR-3 bacterium]|nr:DUF1858 domain-containing protein [candidate division WOR-3 bacterium]
MPNVITPETKLSDIIQKYPKTLEVFQKYNLHCLGCVLAAGESLKDGLLAHGLDVEQVVKEMNDLVSEQDK